MPNQLKTRFALALSLLVLALAGVSRVSAQDAGKPAETNAEGKAEVQDGHDRPTTYPRIKFGGKKAEGEAKPSDDKTAEVAKEDVKVKTRVYLLDISDVMAKSITVDNTRETTRLEHMVAQMERSLDALARRKDPRLRFNIVTFGSVQDFAGGGELQAATEDSARRAKEWLKKLEAKGESDIFNLLRECFEQEPDSATMIVGGKPGESKNLGDELQKKRKLYKDAGEFLLAQVKQWRKDGRKTTLDITGVGLSADEKEYYKRLADAAGGTYLDA